MQIPICENCAQSEELCPECAGKLKRGQISEEDVKVTRILYKLAQKNVISDPSFEKTLPVKEFLIILTSSNAATLIGRGGRIVRIVSEKMGRKVRVVKKGDLRVTVNDLIAPARITGMTTLYTPKEEKHRILVPDEDRKKILFSEDSIREAVKKLCNANIEIKYSP